MNQNYLKNVLQSVFTLILGLFMLYDLALRPDDGFLSGRTRYKVFGWIGAPLIVAASTYSLVQLIFLRHVENTRLDLKSGKSDKALQRTLKQWDNKHNVQNAVALSAAYGHRGDGALAEQFALEAQKLAERETIPQHLREMIWLALADAWNAQGRFDEAGRLMLTQAQQARRPNYFTLSAAFSYFLAKNFSAAATTFSHVRTPDDTPKNWLPDSVKFIAVYLDYKLRRQPKDWKSYRKEVAFWDDEAARNAANPYGARLREILDEIHTLV